MSDVNKTQEEWDSVFSENDSLELFSSLENDNKQARTFKIIVIGDSNVGKTCLTYRFCGGSFLKNPEATIGVDFRERTVQLDGERIKLQIWDTAGQERFRKSMVEHYYRSVHAVLFVYDMTSLLSFESIPEWISECSRHSVGPLVPQVLVGNKCDLRESCQVPTSAAQSLADSHNIPLFETSAKDPSEKEHIDAIFLTLAYRLKSNKTLRLKQPSESSLREMRDQQEQDATSCRC
ncbi:ras-related protein Rab-33B [Nothobranchius furzeri]|uniref:Ras-related protein Rab-33B-like n=2 Tax=Nothobranchius TaxID=28779 RepID=A0A1A8UHB7_NOTFU|nr:ras-related protein Rab-33B-like [Nothobranchius furzeri]KAF7215496.1 ras-related protein Rab-33B-like [Nothobranchius furzeri]